MKQIVSTLNIFLRQEPISLFVYLVATVFFVSLTLSMTPEANTEGVVEPSQVSLLLILMLSVFIGLYLGSGLLRLRQSLLWFTHRHYRLNLIKSFILAAIIYAAIQFYPLYYSGWGLMVSVIAPTCVTLLTAQLVVGATPLLKFSFTLSPLLLFQLQEYQVDHGLLVTLLLALTCLAVYLNATHEKRINNANLGLMSGNIEQQFKSSSLQGLNRYAIKLLALLHIKPAKRDFADALLQPTNRYGISSIVMALACLLFIYLIHNEKQTEVFAMMIMGAMMLSQFMDIQLLSKQTKPIAHLFAKDQHAHFKQKILSMLDKHLALQAVITLLAILIISVLINDFIDPVLMIKLAMTILIIGRCFSPMMLCLNWFNINFKLLAVVGLYAVTSIFASRWLLTHQLSESILEIGLAAILLILLRFASKYLWMRQPIEQFLRVYG